MRRKMARSADTAVRKTVGDHRRRDKQSRRRQLRFSTAMQHSMSSHSAWNDLYSWFLRKTNLHSPSSIYASDRKPSYLISSVVCCYVALERGASHEDAPNRFLRLHNSIRGFGSAGSCMADRQTFPNKFSAVCRYSPMSGSCLRALTGL
jgi:hypothetical protein